MLKSLAKRVHTHRGVWVVRVLCMLGTLLGAGIGAVIGSFMASRPTFGWLTAMVLFVGAIVGGILLSQMFYDLGVWVGQRRRDIDAAALWSVLRDGHPTDRPFTLYLRPFASMDQIDAESARLVNVATAGGPMLSVTSDRRELESEVELGMRRIGPLVALGAPLEHVGAGRIRVDDSIWQDAIERLMDEARLIVLLPSARPGTYWEIQRILTAGRLLKTIVVDPPDDLRPTDAIYDPSEEWDDIRRVFASHGYQLPEDDPEGLLLYFGQARTPVLVQNFSMNGAQSVRLFAQKVLQDVGVQAGRDGLGQHS